MQKVNEAYTVVEVAIAVPRGIKAEDIEKMLENHVEECASGGSELTAKMDPLKHGGILENPTKYYVNFLVEGHELEQTKKEVTTFLKEFVESVQNPEDKDEWQNILEKEEVPNISGFEILVTRKYQW